MAITVIWTKQAKEDFELVLSYLRDNWSDDLTNTFKESTYKKISLLESVPEMGIPSVRYTNVRRILLSRHNALYYQYDSQGSIVFLLNIFDTRANPTDNPFD